MKFEAPKQPSPEDMAKIEKERTLSDAELIKGGAEYKFDEKGSKILEATDKQVENIKQEKWAEKFVDKSVFMSNDIIVGFDRASGLYETKHIEKGDTVKLLNDKNYLVLGFTHSTKKEGDTSVRKDSVHLREVSDAEAEDIDKKKEEFNKLFEVNNYIDECLKFKSKLYGTEDLSVEDKKILREKFFLKVKDIDNKVALTLNGIKNLTLNTKEKTQLVNFVEDYKNYLLKIGRVGDIPPSIVEVTSGLVTNGADTFSVKEYNRLNELNKKEILERNLTADEKYEETYLKHKKERIMQILNPKQWRELQYEPFDPQLELRKVRYFSKEELDNIPLEQRKQIQRERLDNYKEQLLEQKKEIAEIQIDLEKEIRNNPDINLEDLMNSLYMKAPKARLTSSQIDIFRSGLRSYALAHQDIELYRQEYPDDDKLFGACFGRLPKGEMEIIKGPMTFYFRCHNIEDYALIHSGKLDSEERLNEHDVTSANMSGGVKTSKSLLPHFKGVVIAENSFDRSVNKKTYIHEEQHAIHQLFEDERARQDIFMSGLEKSSAKEQEKVLASSLRRKREDFESRAKNEILAYFKDGTDTEQIKQILSKDKKYGGLYDYFKDWYSRDGAKEANELIDSGLNKDLVDETFVNVFITEYRIDIIHPAVEAMQTLSDKGLAKEEIINLLINEPLSKWPKVVKRMQDISDKNFARPEMALIEKTIKEYLELSKSPQGFYNLGGARNKIDELKKEGKLTNEEAGELANRLGL